MSAEAVGGGGTPENQGTRKHLFQHPALQGRSAVVEEVLFVIRSLFCF